MDIYIARQPIFNRKMKVISYELLFRSNKNNYCETIDGNQATYEVIKNTFLSIGIEKLTDGKKAFINFTKDLIINETPTLLPKEYLTIELLENIEPTDQIISACKKLKDLGYTIALDDFVYDPKYSSLIAIADIIKVDFIQTKGIERKKIVDNLKKYDITFLAEKVESKKDFEEAIAYGYEYFQGYFFSKPEIISDKDIPINTKIDISLLQKIYANNLDLNLIEDIIKRDVSLSYKLLKLINSSYYGFKSKITSIKQALMLLGMEQIKKWIMFIVLKQPYKPNYNELLRRTVVRARLGELLANTIDLEALSSEIFLMELLSSLDVVLNKPIDKLLNELSVNEEIKRALKGQNNTLGMIHELLNSYQNGDWSKFDIYAKALGVSKVDISQLYIEALTWVDDYIL